MEKQWLIVYALIDHLNYMRPNSNTRWYFNRPAGFIGKSSNNTWKLLKKVTAERQYQNDPFYWTGVLTVMVKQWPNKRR